MAERWEQGQHLLGLLWEPLALPTGPIGSSFLGSPYRILIMNPQKELLWGLWVNPPCLNPANKTHLLCLGPSSGLVLNAKSAEA